MKKITPWIIAVVLVAIIAAVTYFLFLGTKSQEKKIQQLNEEIINLKTEYMPVRYKVTERSNNKTTVIVKFYDLDEKQIAKQEFTLDGNTIAFDFYVVKFDNGYLAFPSKIFTEQIKPEDGTSLIKFYDDSGFPEIYNSKNNSKKFNEGIKELFEKIKNKDFDNLEDVFGSMVQNNATADSKRDIDVWYKIIVHKPGGIEIQED